MLGLSNFPSCPHPHPYRECRTRELVSTKKQTILSRDIKVNSHSSYSCHNTKAIQTLWGQWYPESPRKATPGHPTFCHELLPAYNVWIKSQSLRACKPFGSIVFCTDILIGWFSKWIPLALGMCQGRGEPAWGPEAGWEGQRKGRAKVDVQGKR